MRLRTTLFGLCLSLAPAVAALSESAPLYVASDEAEPPFERDTALCGTAAGGLLGYAGGVPVCADALLSDLQKDSRLADRARVLLLTSRPDETTHYLVTPARRPVLELAALDRSTAPLTIAGQRNAAGDPLVWFRGLPLIDTLCDPARVADEAACRAGLPATGDLPPLPAWARGYELTSLATVENARAARDAGEADSLAGVTEQPPRAYCIRLHEVAGLRLLDLGFEECWLVALLAVDSHDIALSGSRINGSTFAFLAVATEGRTSDNHSFVLADNRWVQSPGGYRQDALPCKTPQLDLGCVVDLWDELPWGIVHHHLWRPLNGALFAGYNVAGNVLIDGNIVERAFNGVRIWSDAAGSGRNVEIRGNLFRFVRDNPIEPEGRADNWIVKHNVFENAHGWISIDGVAGSGFFVFGNRGWYDPAQMPGSRCRDDIDWSASPIFVGLAGDEGHYRPVDSSYDPSAVACLGHQRGVVLKTGDDARNGFPYLEEVALFHNSWITRSPLFGSKHAPPLVHFNNAISFAGCGLDGPVHCRQVPAPTQYCAAGIERTRGRVQLGQLWSDDGAALVADCFTLTPGPAEPDERATDTREATHLFCRDATDRPLSALPYADGHCAAHVGAPVFSSGLMPEGLPAGCIAVLDQGRVRPDCSSRGAPIGALDENGALFDLAIEGAGYLGADFRP